MYQAYITNIKNVRRHPNADRLDLAECFGNTVCVGHGDFGEGGLVVYFPTDGQLSVEFCAQHDLVRRKDDAGNPCGGYLEPDKRNVKAIRLRGERSDGLVMPLSCLEYTGVDIGTLGAGFAFTAINGHEICQKYIPRSNRRAAAGSGNRTRKKRVNIAPLFVEHADTEQLAYNLSAFRPGDEIEITLKMHGTSQRTGYLPVLQGYTDSFGCRAGNAIRHLLNKMGKYHGKDKHDGEPIYEYGYVSGTRRTVLENYEGGYYGDNSFREQHSKIFEGKLHRGETAYYEVVAFTNDGTPIMGAAKVPSDAQKEYGKVMIFHYGCEATGKKTLYGQDEHGTFSIDKEVPQSAMYLYRMTLTTEEGYVVEYTPELLRYRAEQMGVKCVPVFDKFIVPRDIENAGEYVKTKAEKYYDGPDPIGKTHVREGVVVRIVNRPKFSAFKHKNFLFKRISGIITEQIVDNTEVNNMSEDILSEL